MHAAGSMTRVYQAWEGSNNFLCRGRLIFGPDVKSLVISLVLIIVPGVLFCIFVANEMRGKLAGGVAILPASIVFFCWEICLLLWTSARDPGIVPRNLVPPEPEEDPNFSGSDSFGAGGGRRLPRTKDVVINGHTVKVKYCDTCLLYRPPRCSHCSVCNNCVERFDHHCPWVGQCIGKRNYRYYILLLWSSTLLCIYVFALSAVNVKVLMDNGYSHRPGHHHRTVWRAMEKSVVGVILMGYTFIIVWFVGGLTVFHLYLMSTNQTTYENFRYRYDKKVNPYNQGIRHNVHEALCSPMAPSRNDFRADAPVRPPDGADSDHDGLEGGGHEEGGGAEMEAMEEGKLGAAKGLSSGPAVTVANGEEGGEPPEEGVGDYDSKQYANAAYEDVGYQRGEEGYGRRPRGLKQQAVAYSGPLDTGAGAYDGAAGFDRGAQAAGSGPMPGQHGGLSPGWQEGEDGSDGHLDWRGHEQHQSYGYNGEEAEPIGAEDDGFMEQGPPAGPDRAGDGGEADGVPRQPANGIGRFVANRAREVATSGTLGKLRGDGTAGAAVGGGGGSARREEEGARDSSWAAVQAPSSDARSGRLYAAPEETASGGASPP